MTGFGAKLIRRGLQLHASESNNAFKLLAKSTSSSFQGRFLHQHQNLRTPMQTSSSIFGSSSKAVNTRAFSTSSVSDTVASLIKDNKVLVFSKTYCPFCAATKNTFQQMGIDAKVIELDEMSDGNEVQTALQKLTGQRTVPNVFINGKHLGGNDDTQAAVKSGKLKEMLQ